MLTFRSTLKFDRVPARLPDVPADANPFRDLESRAGLDSPLPAIRRLGEASLNAHPVVLDQSLLIPERLTQWPCADKKQLRSLLHRRISSGHGFFLYSAEGCNFGTGIRRTKRDFEVHAYMSDLVSIIHVHEASTHIQTDALRAAQQGLHHQLLVLPPGGLLVELGAGCDIHRLNALSAYAQQRGGGFVAHDIVPEVARLTEFDLENVPYVSGPPHSQFLGSLLRAAEAPLVVCLKNVLTATAQTALDELTETIRMTNPLRLVVTQTVSMAEASDVYPAGLSPGLNYGENRLLQYLPGPGETAPAEERLQYQLHAHHAGLAYTMSALEVAIDHLRSRLRAEGLFTHARGLAVKTTEIRHGESAKEFITLMTKGRGLPFENLNSVVIGPFGIRWSTDKKLPPGALRINWFEVHWVFDNQGRLDIQPAENQTVEMFEGAIPAIPSAMTHYTDAESDAFGRIKSHGRLRFSSATNFQLLRETGAAKGVELLFQLGEATSHPLITAARARGYDAALRAAFSRQRP